MEFKHENLRMTIIEYFCDILFFQAKLVQKFQYLYSS